MDSGEPFQRPAQAAGKTGSVGREPGPPVDQAQSVRRPGARPALVVVVEKLGLVGGHVHPGGALRAARLAGQAEVEGFADLLAAPAVPDHAALQHLEEKARPAPGRVLLLAGRHEAGAHRAAPLAAALADADAAAGGTNEAAGISWIAEGGLRTLKGQAGTEVRVERIGIDLLAGVHPVAGVPDGLELAEGLHQLFAEHAGEQLASLLAVAMLAGERAAVSGHEVRRLLEERAVPADSLRAGQVEVDAGVEAALSEVAVEGGAIAVAAQEGLQVSQVGSEPVRGHGRVLPAGPGIAEAGIAGGRPHGGLAHLPDLRLLFGILDDERRPAD